MEPPADPPRFQREGRVERQARVDRQRRGSGLPAAPARAPARHRLTPLPGRRRAAGWVLAAAVTPLLTLLLASFRATMGATGALPELLFAVVVVAVVGGLLPALVSAVTAFALADWYLVPPLHTLTVNRAGNTLALVSFVVTAALVSTVIDRLTRRNAEMVRARAESEALARLAGGAVLAPREALPSIVGQLHAAFGADAVAVLAPSGQAGGWTVEAAAGGPVPARPADAAFCAELAAGSMLVVTGGSLAGDDRRLLAAFVAQLRVVQEQQQLQAAAAVIPGLEQANELRTALLSAVSHDLRSPLASIKASATSLLSSEVDWGPEARRAFAATIDGEADRLDRLVADLLDMSRLQAGVLHLRVREVGLDEVVGAALASLSADTGAVRVDVADTLTPVVADPDLLERSIANLVANALAWSPSGGVVTVAGAAVGPGGVQLHIVDHGPGIPVQDRARALLPFQRVAERPGGGGGGVGLGLAVARGFVDLMGGGLALADTPGGGLAAITLPAGEAGPPAATTLRAEPAVTGAR